MNYMSNAGVLDGDIQEMLVDEIDLIDGAKLSESLAFFAGAAVFVPVAGDVAAAFLAGAALGAYLSGN